MRPLLVLLVLALARPAHALDARVQFLLRQLQQAKDPRARAQAAIMLGGAPDAAVTRSLCAALGDASALVRASAARSLGKLADPGGKGCLSAQSAEKDPTVRAELSRALAALSPARAAPEPAATAYVSIAASARLAGPDGAALARLTEEELDKRVRGMGGRLAPPHEDAAHAERVLQESRLKGLALRTVVSSTPGGGLALDITCFTYPGRALLGEVSVSASGAAPPVLVRALVPKALEETSQACNWSR